MLVASFAPFWLRFGVRVKVYRLIESGVGFWVFARTLIPTGTVISEQYIAYQPRDTFSQIVMGHPLFDTILLRTVFSISLTHRALLTAGDVFYSECVQYVFCK